MLIDERILHAFSHAAYYAYNQALGAFALKGVQLIEARENFLFGVVANRASVDENGVGIVERLAHAVACHFHHRSHHLAVGNVHLAAISLDEEHFAELFGLICEIHIIH